MLLKEILLLLLPFLKPAIYKFIEYVVKRAEEIFIGLRQGKTKKAYVLKEIYQYFKANPEEFEYLKNKFGEKLDDKIDELIEKAVKKLT